MLARILSVFLVVACCPSPLFAEVSAQNSALAAENSHNSQEVQLAQNSYLARPGDITLKGNIRRERVSTELGNVELRWPRSVEVLFGRTPLRAVIAAARTVRRATRTAAFPREVQQLKPNWQIVFMDEKLPERQIPHNLISGCHPGWMVPPANIYIVAQRVAAGCGGSRPASASVADSQLEEVLVHEMGHSVEFHILKNEFGRDRKRAEGFATWFEMYASGYSSQINGRELKRETYARAKYAVKQNPGSFHFDGSALSYARASMYMAAIVDRRGIRGLMDVYRVMGEQHLSFSDAVEKKLLWKRAQLEKEVLRHMEKH